MAATFIYFLRPVGGGPVKIGCSQEPRSRLRDYMKWSPVPLELVAAAPGSLATEGQLHRRFSASRLHHEWFASTDELDAFVTAVAATGHIEAPTELRVIPRHLCRPHLREHLGSAQASLADLAGELKLKVATVRAWPHVGVPACWMDGVLAFFARRGLALMATDINSPRPANDFHSVAGQDAA